MRVSVDVDGVLHNFEGGLRAFLRDKWGHPEHLMTDPQQWSFHDDWGLTLQQFKDACNAGVNARYVFFKGDPYEGAAEAMQRIKADGHEIHIVTARFYGAPGMAQYLTARWLDKYHIPYDTLTFSRDKTVVQSDVMVEDNLDNAYALRNADIEAVVMDRPWNKGERIQHLSWPMRRVGNMIEFADMLPEIEADLYPFKDCV